MTSDRAAGSFAVPVGSGVTVSGTGFHDVDYHSGDGIGGVDFDGTDWAATEGGGELAWATEDHATNDNANALRWGTLYNFRFQADRPPAPAQIEIGLFKPPTKASPPSVVTVTAVGPAPVALCPADVNGDGVVNALDLIDLLLCLGQPATPPCDTADVNGDTFVNALDLIDLLLDLGLICP